MIIDYHKYPLPKRLRHHTKPNLYMKYDDLKEKPEYYPPRFDRMDWTQLFANGNPPDMLDIGCGKGLFMLNMSEQFPSKNILGVEVRKPVVEWINGFVAGEKIPNCSALWYSVANGFGFISTASLEKIFYLFPDPWQKRKHIKRRVFCTEFLDEIYRIMKPDGRLFIATDVDEIHDYHLSILTKSEKFSFDEIVNNDDWGLPTTNKENFCIRENIPYFKIIVKKKIQ